MLFYDVIKMLKVHNYTTAGVHLALSGFLVLKRNRNKIKTNMAIMEEKKHDLCSVTMTVCVCVYAVCAHAIQCSFFVCFFFFLVVQHMEVPRLGVKLELWLPA